MRAVVIGLTLAAIVATPSYASTTERVQDGGFEASTCDASECNDPVWQDHATSAFSNLTGPICRAGTGSGDTACTGQGSVPFIGSTWLRLGAGYKANAMFGGGIISWVDQTVSIPTAPATLSLRLRIIDSAGPTGEFRVEVGGGDSDGTVVFSATDATPGFASYAPVSVDLSSFAGSSPRLRLVGISSQTPVGLLDSFDVDDVSLTTTNPVDPRCATLRAKLKKAKAKHRKRKVRKLRKKLVALGC